MGGEGWKPAVPMSELQEGRGFRASVDGVEVLLVRAGDTVFAVANRCTHQGAPLDRGTVRLAGSPHTVTCPAHGSTFDLESGGVTRGPATQPLPAYEARIVEGVVEVRPKP